MFVIRERLYTHPVYYVLLLRNNGARSRCSVGYALRHGGKSRQNSMNWRLAGFQNRSWPLLERVSNRNDGFIVEVVESSVFSACEFIKGEFRTFSSVTHTKLSIVLVFILQSEVIGRFFLYLSAATRKSTVSSLDLHLPSLNNSHKK